MSRTLRKLPSGAELPVGVDVRGPLGKQRVRIWWRERGDRYREPLPGVARSPRELERLVRQAAKLRQRKVTEAEAGRFHTPGTARVEDLEAALLRDHQMKHRKCRRADRLWDYWRGLRVVDIDTVALKKFVAAWQADGLAASTICVALAFLKRAFK